MKKILPLIAALLFTAAGCSSATPENTAAVKAAAFDASPRGIKLTALITDPGTDKSFSAISAEGASMTELNHRLNDASGKTPFFTQCDVLIFSYELAKNGVGELLDWFCSEEGRKEALCVISESTAEDAFLYTDGFIEDPSSDISRMLKNSQKNGSGICITAAEANSAKNSLYETSLIPICGLTDKADSKSLCMTGAGILKSGKYTGKLTKEELAGVKMILSSFTGHAVSTLPVRITSCRTKKLVRGDELRFETVVSYMPDTENLLSPNTAEELSRYIRECISLAALRALADGDFLGFFPPGHPNDPDGTDVSVSVKTVMSEGSYMFKGALSDE